MTKSTRWVLREFLSILVVMALVLIARSSFADHYHVPSGSMFPSVEAGDRVLVNKSAYGLRVPLTKLRISKAEMPTRGDVVVLESPESDLVLLKRVVALAGDSVRVQRGRLVLNGTPVSVAGGVEQLGDPPHAVHVGSGGPSFGPAQVPQGQLLVMGDNRGNSRDGRMFGFVSAEAVLGRATAVYFRDGSFRWIPL